MRPLKLRMVQALRAGDRAKCVKLRNVILRDMEDEKFLPRLIFSYEATFFIRRKVNRRNVGTWGLENSEEILEHLRDFQRLTCFVPFL